MSKLPDKLIYDNQENKYFIYTSGKIQYVPIDEIKKNCKNINNHNMHYILFDTPKFLEINIINH